jgi:S1-C subfamily serine protease
MPWQGSRPSTGTGTGFVISKKRILTNAHVVSDASLIHVQRDGDATRYRARVAFVGHDCDLAILSVDEPTFFDKTQPVTFATSIPHLNDVVTVYGYPMGGDRLSVTRGVVSRIDYSGYSHSGADQHLVLQVDAAINPGNSGGPVFFDDRVVGLAFQGISWAENIGYAIPLPVLNHFLDDVDDNVHDGYPELGVAYLNLRNDALRKDLGLSDAMTGVVVYYIDPFGSAKNHLLNKDVLLAIDGYKIANDGTVELNGNSVVFAELLERKQAGEAATFDVLRDGKTAKITVPLIVPDDPFIYKNLYDERPEYYLHGGLVFSPLSREYLRTLGRGGSHDLVYYSQFAKIDSLYGDRDEFVVLTRRLPHAVNTYANGFLNKIVREINGTPINSLKDVELAMASPKKGNYHIIHFENTDDALIVDARAASAADPEILTDYGIAASKYFKDEEEARK